jgi:DNA-binding NarL/FixJ family response regulator
MPIARAQISGATTWDQMWAERRSMSLDAAIDYALSSATALEKESSEARPAGLSKRELDVLRLVAQGLTDAEVAEQLFLARRTVNTHLTSIYTKLGVNSRSAATRYAVEHGLT